MSAPPPVRPSGGLAARGDLVRTDGGATGIFIGRDSSGTEWIAYRVCDVAPMAAAFDRRKA